MRYDVYNLEFPHQTEEIVIGDYAFEPVEDYETKVLSLHDSRLVKSDLGLVPVNLFGTHCCTATVRVPEREPPSAIEFRKKTHDTTGLDDIQLLLSLFTRRNVIVDRRDDCHVRPYLWQDPRRFPWGASLADSISYTEEIVDIEKVSFGRCIKDIYDRITQAEWRKQFKNGFFLLLLHGALQEAVEEFCFLRCWTIWEHLFAIRHSKNTAINTWTTEKLKFVLLQHAESNQIDSRREERIRAICELRNKLVHHGMLPRSKPDKLENSDLFLLFVFMTEYVVAKILGLEPKDYLGNFYGNTSR